MTTHRTSDTAGTPPDEPGRKLSIAEYLEAIKPIQEAILARRGGKPFTAEEMDEILGICDDEPLPASPEEIGDLPNSDPSNYGTKSISEVLESLKPIHERILARRGGEPFTREQIDRVLDEIRGHCDPDLD